MKYSSNSMGSSFDTDTEAQSRHTPAGSANWLTMSTRCKLSQVIRGMEINQILVPNENIYHMQLENNSGGAPIAKRQQAWSLLNRID